MATYTKPPFFVKVVWKMFQFKKIIFANLALQNFCQLKLSVNLGQNLQCQPTTYLSTANTTKDYSEFTADRFPDQNIKRILSLVVSISKRLILGLTTLRILALPIFDASEDFLYSLIYKVLFSLINIFNVLFSLLLFSTF